MLQSMIDRFVTISQMQVAFHCSHTPIFNVTEIIIIAFGTYLPKLSQDSRKREYSSTTGEAGQRTYNEVLPGLDHMRRFYVWE